MDDKTLMTAIDYAIEQVLRTHYDTCEERDAALRQAMRELNVD